MWGVFSLKRICKLQIHLFCHSSQNSTQHPVWLVYCVCHVCTRQVNIIHLLSANQRNNQPSLLEYQQISKWEQNTHHNTSYQEAGNTNCCHSPNLRHFEKCNIRMEIMETLQF